MSLDKLQWFPNQDVLNLPTACVAFSACDIAGNLMNTQMEPEFSYAATLRVMNEVPETAGSDPYSGIISTVVYGTLPAQDETFTAVTTSELYAANWANYNPSQKALALLEAQNGITLLDSWGDILAWVTSGKSGVMLPVTFYSSFWNKNSDGTLPAPSGSTSNHCTALYDANADGSINMKMWLGSGYGYAKLTENIFNQIWDNEAWGINTSASRWLSLASASVVRPYIIADTLPQMIKLTV